MEERLKTVLTDFSIMETPFSRLMIKASLPLMAFSSKNNIYYCAKHWMPCRVVSTVIVLKLKR